MAKKALKMNIFVYFSILLRRHAPGPINMIRGLQTKVLKFLWQKNGSQNTILSPFFKIFPGGIPPDPPSMTRGLQTKRLSLYGQKGSKLKNCVHFFNIFEGACLRTH